VDDRPGTTRDPVDELFEHGGESYRIVDTAGIRRRAGRSEEIERVSVLKAKQALEEAALAIVLVDAGSEIGHQDRAILGLVADQRTPAVVAANKIDLVPATGGALSKRLEEIRAALGFASYIPIVPLSALKGTGVDRLLATLDTVRKESLRRFTTTELNRALQEIVAEKQPPADAGREVRFYYMTQGGGEPPRFIVFGNGRRIPEPYRRYMTGRLRSRLGLTVSPLILSFRRSRP